jgi:hypothetical protein
MDNEKLKNSYNDPDAIPGVVEKVASVSPVDVTADDMKKINRYTLAPVSAEDVFVFKAVIADNEQDDRNYMPFDLKALQDLYKLYPGKTMLKDHSRRADNQIARVFDTELVQNANKTTELGELHTELHAKIYMLKTESNKDLIAEILGGIKKEVSTSATPTKMICNICGTDNMEKYCRHYPGVNYTIEDGSAKGTKKRCKMLLSGAKEAYELSFVAVPAQPRAGTHKSVGFTKPVAETPEENPEIKSENDTDCIENNINFEKMDERILESRVKNVESFFNFESEDN